MLRQHYCYLISHMCAAEIALLLLFLLTYEIRDCFSRYQDLSTRTVYMYY